jgi:hypothetical protein
MKKENVIETCYSLLRNVTPLEYDCGEICNGKCCKGDGKTGMLLFPGEENLIDPQINIIKNERGDSLAVCNGTCDRNKRPLACRIYPIFPIIKKDEVGEYIEVDFDSRADCPLVKGDYEITRDFVKKVKRVGKYLLLNEETQKYYRELSDEIQEYIVLKNFFEK